MNYIHTRHVYVYVHISMHVHSCGHMFIQRQAEAVPPPHPHATQPTLVHSRICCAVPPPLYLPPTSGMQSSPNALPPSAAVRLAAVPAAKTPLRVASRLHALPGSRSPQTQRQALVVVAALIRALPQLLLVAVLLQLQAQHWSHRMLLLAAAATRHHHHSSLATASCRHVSVCVCGGG